MARYFLGVYSECEWNLIKEAAKAEGYDEKSMQKFVKKRVRMAVRNLPNCPTDKVCRRHSPSIYFTSHVFDNGGNEYQSSDGAVLEKILNYCRFHQVQPTTLLRRLATEPILAQSLLAAELLH